MPLPDSAFRHLPHLRDLIADPASSFFRDLDMALIDARVIAAGGPPDWRRPTEQREALRREILDNRPSPDLWVFAYGSLMWDPAIYFDELRRAHTPDYARSFCLWNQYGRGTPEKPGLMAALDRGEGCTGYAFRIPEAWAEEESFHLCARELIGPAYIPRFISVDTEQGPVAALTFVADHEADTIVADLSIDTQARMLAEASGFLGRSMTYIESMASHLDAMGIDDPYVRDLRDRARAIADMGAA